MTNNRPVTIRDVANRASVAISSVSRVFSLHPNVSGAMKDRVLAAAEELGYTPDPQAQSLRNGYTKTIGFAVRDFANPFFSDIIFGVEETLNESGYTLLVTNSSGDDQREVDRLEVLRQRRVDALLFSSISEESKGSEIVSTRFDRPVVLIDRDARGRRNSSVVLDHAVGVLDATSDLISLGHERIGLVTGTAEIRPTRERLRGYSEALKKADIEDDPSLHVSGAFSVTFARDATLKILKLPAKKRPTAIIAGGVQTTIGVLEALNSSDVRPGDDISLVVCDDLPWLRIMHPQISVVQRDGAEMGRQAAKLALDIIRGGVPRMVVLPTSYEPRETSRPVPIRARAGSRSQT